MISQSVEYALRAMSFLATLEGGAASSVVIARTTRVPQGYLSKVMRELVRGGLVRSYRGPKGGFVLSRAPASISVLDVVNAVDPIERIERCPLGNPAHANLCPLHRCIDEALAQVELDFSRTSLGAVLEHAGRGRCCQALFGSQDRVQDRDHEPTRRKESA